MKKLAIKKVKKLRNTHFFYHTVTCKTYKKHVKIYREVTSSQGANFLQYAVDNIVAWSNEWNLKLYDSEIVNRMS